MRELLVPTADVLKRVHDAVIRARGEPGYITEGLVEGCVERAITYVYEFEPFREIFLKAASFLYCIIVFHPFVDGNKRTALWGTAFMLLINGYLFENLPEDSVEFAKAIAEGKVTDVKDIAEWLRSHSKKTLRTRLLARGILANIRASSRSEWLRKQGTSRQISRSVRLIESP